MKSIKDTMIAFRDTSSKQQSLKKIAHNNGLSLSTLMVYITDYFLSAGPVIKLTREIKK